MHDWLPSAVYVVAVLVVALRPLRVAEDRPAWAAFAIGLGLYALGNLPWAFWLEHLDSPPIPSVSDALWLALYPFSYVGIALLAWPRGRRVPAGVWLDGLLAALGVTALGAAFGTTVQIALPSHAGATGEPPTPAHQPASTGSPPARPRVRRGPLRRRGHAPDADLDSNSARHHR